MDFGKRYQLQIDFNQRYKFDPKRDLIGAGENIAVYRATDSVFNRQVALKFYKKRVFQKIGLIDEIKTLINFSHPNIVKYYDGTVQDFIDEQWDIGIMEYVSGGNLYEFLKIRPHQSTFNEVIKGILNGLMFIHNSGIIHKDIKPQNILMQQVENNWIPKIADFGISSLYDVNSTSSDSFNGTIEYLAPEQFQPHLYAFNGKAAANLDLWSFGVILTEIFYGKPLFGRRTEIPPKQIIANILNMKIPENFQGINPMFQAMIKKCLVREAWNRVQNAQELIDILEQESKKTDYSVSNNEAKIFRKRYQFDPNKDLLGTGGFSKTYKAFDTITHRYVALKFLTGDTVPKYGILEEMKKGVRLIHPNIRQHYNFESFSATDVHGAEQKIDVGILEYVNGGTFSDFLKSRPDETTFNEVIAGVLIGLSYLHKNGIIHRDLKPANILMQREKNTWLPKIHDFGISKALDAQTVSSAIVGTYHYMAPEQIDASKYGIKGKLGTNVDLWAFGVILTEIFLGRPLFGRTNGEHSLPQLLSNILHQEIPDRISGIPQPYHSMVKRCLVRNANLRVGSAGQLLEMLNEKIPIPN